MLKYEPDGHPSEHALRYWQRPRPGSGCVRLAFAAGNDPAVSAELLREPAGDRLLGAVERHRRLELPVRKLRQSFNRSGDARVLLDVVVPRREIRVADRPVDGDALAAVGLEVEIAESVALAAPGQRAAADVIAAIPVEALDLGVRRLLLVHPPVEVLLVERIVALQHRIGVDHRARAAGAIRILPRRPCGRSGNPSDVRCSCRARAGARASRARSAPWRPSRRKSRTRRRSHRSFRLVAWDDLARPIV